MLEVPCLSGNGIMVRIRLVFPGVPTDRGPAPINSITPFNHILAAGRAGSTQAGTVLSD